MIRLLVSSCDQGDEVRDILLRGAWGGGVFTMRASTMQALRRGAQRHMSTVPAAAGNFFPGVKRMTDLVIERGEGSTLWTRDGEEYLDLTSGIGVVSTGHCHPHVVAAVREQAGKVTHAQMSVCISDAQVRLVEKMLPVLPGDMDRVFFANSGAEAVENALRTARLATGRDGILALHGGYHGRTAATLAVTSSNPSYRGSRSGPLPYGSFFTPYPYEYAGVSTQQALDALDMLVRTQVNGSELAAVIIEPVLGEGGYVVPPQEYMAGLRAFCDEHGMLLIADEVQSGVARTGKMWAIDHFEDCRPDILVTAKGLASGYPLSSVCTRADVIKDSQALNSFGGTYGGNAVACAAAIATLEVIESEGLLQNAAARGEQFIEGFHKMQTSSSACAGLIGDIRGRGLMLGLEFSPEMGANYLGMSARVSQECLKRGVMLLPTGIRQTIRFAPALVLSESETEQALAVFEEAVIAAAASA